LAGCSSDDAGEDGAPAVDTTAADAEEDTTESLPGVSCELACKRAPKCEATLTDEAGCLVNCNQADDPGQYACCIQYASNCGEVGQCITGLKTTCEPDGEPWSPIPMFGECECSDGTSMPDVQRECKETAPDHRCETGTCIKPRGEPLPGFCAVDCTDNADACPPDTKCQTTPQSWYCKPAP